MESWPGRKRPWEEERPVDIGDKRREAPKTPFSPPSYSQLSLSGASYFHHSRALSPRQLPPLGRPFCDLPAEPIPSFPQDLLTTVPRTAPLDQQQVRPQSSSDTIQHPDWPGHQRSRTEQSIVHTRIQSPNSSAQRRDVAGDCPSFDNEAAPSEVQLANCCPITCCGQGCCDLRKLLGKLAVGLGSLATKVSTITRVECPLVNNILSEPDRFNNLESLQWISDVVQRIDCALSEHAEHHSLHTLETSLSTDASPTMRRGQHFLEEREEQLAPIRPRPSFQHDNLSFARIETTIENRFSKPSESEPYRFRSLDYTTHSSEPPSGSAQSPKQTAQHVPSAFLPSPSSLSFLNTHNLPTISPPLTSINISAQNAHTQDLQHQISVKRLALQTLQREYDSILQTLERQKTKCAVLEKKFQVSDVEINALTDDKERMLVQITALETQIEELRQSRDEARQQSVASAAQYMRIMDMSNQLQTQSAQGKKKWEAERQELKKRIEALEKAKANGTENAASSTRQSSQVAPASPPFIPAHDASLSSPSQQSELVRLLRLQIATLQSRADSTETALESMRQEGIAIQAAAQQLLASGDKMQKEASDILQHGGSKP